MNQPLISYRTEGRRPARIRRIAWIVGIVLLVMVLALIVLRQTADRWLFGGYEESLTNAQIQTLGGFKLPPSATRIKARVREWQGRLLVVHFMMSPADADGLAQSLGMTRPLPGNSITPCVTKDTEWYAPWWRPGKPSKFETDESQDSKTEVDQQVLIDETNPKQFSVWIVSSHG